jgi:hypothetical protein
VFLDFLRRLNAADGNGGRLSNRLNPSIGRIRCLDPAVVLLKSGYSNTCCFVAFLKIWDVLLHPTKNGGVGQGNAPFCHHLDQVTGA